MLELRKGVQLKERVMKELERRYQLLERGRTTVVSFLKNKIKAASTKIKNFVKNSITTRQNKLFATNQSQLYKEFAGQTSTQNEPPKSEEAKVFWEEIWGKEGKHQDKSGWLNDIQDAHCEIKRQADVKISVSDVRKEIAGMKNWKAPGPDGVRGFWFKKFTSIHEPLALALNNCINEENVPGWMVKGRTVLIQKDPAKGTVASNYRPITCLPLMWKLLSGIFAGKIYEHLENQ